MRLLRLIVLLLLSTASLCQAALPPRSGADLRRDARVVAVGVVENVATAEERRANGFIDKIYRLRIRVETAEKGAPPATLTARGWNILSRPPGWVGPAGVYGLGEISAGQRVRVYLKSGHSHSEYDLLEPNGIEPLAARPVH